ncbi:hypothetical protein [Kitasatospora mediocidica]|uniref:hypothetical protein n=1 Tax=Kitasatospora mediocidica TaxID=58352 RepID=UPI00068EFDA1|nr:hypothetical protein [Kitasatospora mediocidica]
MTEDQHEARGRAEAPGSFDSAEEQMLRALLHRAVDGLQPTPDALPRIRRAVPARRARRRQAWTSAGLAAAVLAVAVPTLQSLGGLQLSDGSAAGPGTVRPSEERGGSGPASKGRRPLPGLPRTGAADDGDATSASTPPPIAGASALSAPGSGPSGAVPAAPDCAAADLGRASALVGTPDATGRRYGLFTVSNVSGRACLLTDPGTLTVSGGAGPVTVLVHTLGDPADALPDPATLPGRLLLPVAASYQLSFAWVPTALCQPGGASSSAAPTAGPSPSASLDPTAGASPGAGQPGATGSTGGPGAQGGSPSRPAGAVPAAESGGPGSADESPGGGFTLPSGGGAVGRSSAAAGSSASAAPSSDRSTASGTLTVAERPAGDGPVAASAQLDGVCGGGTVYRSLPQPAS